MPVGAHSMVDSSALVHNLPALRAALARDGYLFLPALIPRNLVLDGMQKVMTAVGDAVIPGVRGSELMLRPGATGNEDSDAGIVTSHKADQLMADAAVRRVIGSDQIVGVFEQLFEGRSVAAYDHKWFRCVTPGMRSSLHMDSIHFGRSSPGGSLDSDPHTLWFPWTDLPLDVGGLLLLEGSNRLEGFRRMRETYGQTVDSCCANLSDTVFIADEPDRLPGYDPEARWVCGREGAHSYRSGDVVIFSKFTLHGATPNTSTNGVRLSSDVRFQAADEPCDYKHTLTAGRELGLLNQSVTHMAAMHARFDRVKGSFANHTARRTMAEAIAEWGLRLPPRAAVAKL